MSSGNWPIELHCPFLMLSSIVLLCSKNTNEIRAIQNSPPPSSTLSIPFSFFLLFIVTQSAIWFESTDPQQAGQYKSINILSPSTPRSFFFLAFFIVTWSGGKPSLGIVFLGHLEGHWPGNHIIINITIREASNPSPRPTAENFLRPNEGENRLTSYVVFRWS